MLTTQLVHLSCMTQLYNFVSDALLLFTELAPDGLQALPKTKRLHFVFCVTALTNHHVKDCESDYYLQIKKLTCIDQHKAVLIDAGQLLDLMIPADS